MTQTSTEFGNASLSCSRRLPFQVHKEDGCCSCVSIYRIHVISPYPSIFIVSSRYLSCSQNKIMPSAGTPTPSRDLVAKTVMSEIGPKCRSPRPRTSSTSSSKKRTTTTTATTSRQGEEGDNTSSIQESTPKQVKIDHSSLAASFHHEILRDESSEPKRPVPRSRRHRQTTGGETFQHNPYPPLERKRHVFAFAEDICRLVDEELGNA